MRIDGFFLTRYAESTPAGFTCVGGGWTTWNVTEPAPPMEGGGEAPAAVIAGAVLCRIMLSPEESAGMHRFALRLLDADDGELVSTPVELEVQRDPELPRSWEQPIPLTMPFGGLAVERPGLYRFVFEHDGERLAVCPFQVIRRY